MENLYEQLNKLHSRYADNDYVIGRMRTFIMQQLPTYLEQAEKTNKDRTRRKELLNEHADKFIKLFMARNQYYYCPRIELFVEYKNPHFSAISEDDIQHQILTHINTKANLIPWKHKLKNSVIRLIKERNPLHAIPESETIQYVLSQLYPTFLTTKNAAKHFLTAVGDSIRGNKEKTYIVPSILKSIIREIETVYFKDFGGTNVLGNFKLKYHGHDYKETRFFDCRSDITNITVSQDLSKHMLDLLCVAYHYSDRHENADNYATMSGDDSLTNIVFFSKELTASTLVENFKKEALFVSSDTSIKGKNMTFILKKYFDEKNVPNIIFYPDFYTELKKLVEYDETNDVYKDVSSSHLPIVSAFCNFWDTIMTSDIDAPELEIDEIATIFSDYNNSGNVSSDFILDLLRHHYPELVVEEDKYVHGIFCKLWDKRLQVENMVQGIILSTEDKPLSLYDMYSQYTTGHSPRMSKRCFEKIANETLNLSDNGDIVWSITEN